MKDRKTTTLGIRILKEEKEILQNEADKRGLTLSDFVKEMIHTMIVKKVKESSPGKNSPGKNSPGKNSPGKNLMPEEKELDNLLEAAILYKEGKLDI